MKTASETQLETTVAATIAGEDVSCGDFVAVLNSICELPSYLWDGCDARLSPYELVRLQVIPSEAGLPLKVFAVCLPFIYAKTATGEARTIDLRRVHIVRLDRASAKLVRSELKQALQERRSLIVFIWNVCVFGSTAGSEYMLIRGTRVQFPLAQAIAQSAEHREVARPVLVQPFVEPLFFR